MLALVVSSDGALTPPRRASKARPVVLMQGGIHAGEIDGKDAGFLAAARDARGQGRCRGVLNRVTLVFVPVFNVDGHERFGRWNRPNQTGPEEMGWRVTSAEPQPQPRLRQGRRARDAGDAAPAEAMGSDPLRRSARHRRRAVRARRRRITSRRLSPATPELRAAGRGLLRRADAAAHRAGLAAARLLSVVPRATTIRRPASPSTSDRRASRTGYWALRNASASSSRRIRGRTIRRACASRATPSSRCSELTAAAAARRGASAARRPTSAAPRLGGSAVAAAIARDGPTRQDDRLPRLRLHARAVGRLGRAGDALRPDDAADLARAALR